MTDAARLSWIDVRDHVRRAILNGDYATGERLPRDADLAEALGCARSTVQRAMRDLSNSGVIERRRKGGTRVRPDPVRRAVLEVPVIRDEIERAGRAYGYRLIGRAIGPAPAALRAAEAAEMLRVEALHLSDGRPWLLEDRWIYLATVPEAILDVDLSAISANEWLVANRPYSRCDLSIGAENAEAAPARLLAVDPGAALLTMTRATWIGDAPITHVRTMAAPGYLLKARI